MLLVAVVDITGFELVAVAGVSVAVAFALAVVVAVADIVVAEDTVVVIGVKVDVAFGDDAVIVGAALVAVVAEGVIARVVIVAAEVVDAPEPVALRAVSSLTVPLSSRSSARSFQLVNRFEMNLGGVKNDKNLDLSFDLPLPLDEDDEVVCLPDSCGATATAALLCKSEAANCKPLAPLACINAPEPPAENGFWPKAPADDNSAAILPLPSPEPAPVPVRTDPGNMAASAACCIGPRPICLKALLTDCRAS